MNKQRRGDYGNAPNTLAPIPKRPPTKQPTMKTAAKAKAGPSMPSQSYGFSVSGSTGSDKGRAPGAGIVTYSSKVTKGR